MIVIENKFDFGQTVYLKTDEDQKARLVVRITLTVAGTLVYGLSCGTNETTHFEIELSDEKNVLVG